MSGVTSTRTASRATAMDNHHADDRCCGLPNKSLPRRSGQQRVKKWCFELLEMRALTEITQQMPRHQSRLDFSSASAFCLAHFVWLSRLCSTITADEKLAPRKHSLKRRRSSVIVRNLVQCVQFWITCASRSKKADYYGEPKIC